MAFDQMVQVSQRDLKRALATVGHAVATRSTLPVLSNILMVVDSTGFTLTANNLEINITTTVPARPIQDAAITVPAKLLGELVANLPDDIVSIGMEGRTQSIQIGCRGTKATVKGIEADEFPASAMDSLKGVPPLCTLDRALLSAAIQKVALAAAVEHTNPILQGVLFRFHGDTLTLAGIDGYRLAVEHVRLNTPVSQQLDVIIPATALESLARVIQGYEGEITMLVAPNGSQVVFQTDTLDFVSRVIDGKFPDYERFVPQPTSDTTRTVLTTDELLKAVKRVGLFSQAAGNIVTLTMEPHTSGSSARLTLTANATEVGDSVEYVDALLDGPGGKLALNVKYLQEALSVMTSDQVALETQSPNSPGVFRPIGQGSDYLHLVMPMRIP